MKNYKKGKQIKTIDELIAQRLVFCDCGINGYLRSISFFKSWQLQTVLTTLQLGKFYTVEKITE